MERTNKLEDWGFGHRGGRNKKIRIKMHTSLDWAKKYIYIQVISIFLTRIQCTRTLVSVRNIEIACIEVQTPMHKNENIQI